MTVTKPGLTEQEFLNLPDDGRKYELIDGEARAVPAGVRHDILGANIIALLKPFTRGRGFLCTSQAGFRMANGNVRSPDVSYIRKVRFPDGQPPTGFGDFAPDLCIEIISPTESRTEMATKVAEYFAAGAEQVWHLFPETQRLVIYTSPLDHRAYEATDTVTIGDLLPGFACSAADLFDLE